MNRKKIRIPGYLPFLVPAFFLLVFVRPYLLRDLWFDEALTLMNFALLPSPLAIYRSYVIPNNHILYTILLHGWIRLPDPGLRQDFLLRLPSLLLAAASLCVLYGSFRRALGRTPLLIALTALAVSPPFLVYASAVRGYMAGCFFVSLAAGAACGFARRPGGRIFCGYFLCCLLAVGTVPSDLLALCGCVLWALPYTGNRFPPWRRALLLAGAPFAALALFYLPILPSFLAVCRLGEGWSDGAGVVRAFAAAAAAAVGIPGVLFLFSCVLRGEKYPWRTGMYAAVCLLPLPAAFLLSPAPFPRVFLPLFPLLALLSARGIRDGAAFCRLKRGGKGRVFFAILAVCAVAGGLLLQTGSCRAALSKICGDAPEDDFFSGYYLRPEHRPSLTAERLSKMYAPENLPPVFMSFAADPWPTMYYLLERGLRTQFLFDGPRGRVNSLLPGTLVVLSRGEEPENTARRFAVRLVPLFDTVKHRVFAVE